LYEKTLLERQLYVTVEAEVDEEEQMLGRDSGY
jgi:hypothetical protein